MPPIDHESPIYAAVELGSDSFRLHIGRFNDGVLELVATMCEKVELSASLDEDGMLGSAALRGALACLAQFRGALDAWRPHAVRVVATAALRMARNASLFLSAAGRALGHPVDIIAGDEAGRLVYLGVVNTLGSADCAPRLVLDIGGVSTELVIGEGAAIRRIESFALGAVRQSLTFFASGRIDGAGFDAAVRSSRSRFAEAGLGARGWDMAYGACGTVRALAGHAHRGQNTGTPLTQADLAVLRDVFIATREGAHLAGGLALLWGLMEELEIAAVTPVTAGLRVGALWDMHQRAGAVGATLAHPVGVV
jgi:exopolyphosphatase/pppGpp-phosphohydrolase